MYVKIEENKACNKETAYIFTSKEELEKEDIQKEISEENKAIIEETYLEMEREKQLQIYQTDKKIKELESLNNNKLIEKAKSQYDLYMNFINKEKLNRGQVESIVNSIYVNKNLSLDIILNDNLKEIIEF